jgi:hypothetical protein
VASELIKQSTAPATSILSHLALTTAHPGRLAPSVDAAIYASLRTLFAPVRSRISFYDESSYLDPANWELLTTDTLPTLVSDPVTYPHLADASVDIPRLNAGDMVFRHASIPVAPVSVGVEGVFAPVSPLPRTRANEAYVAKQREAFEHGLPPSHAANGGMAQLEVAGSADMIESYGGKRAMGY